MSIALEEEEKGPVLVRENIVARALNRVGSTEYRNLLIGRPGGKLEEVIYNGEYACAYETTCALHNLGLLEATHSTVDGFEAEVKESPDWILIDSPTAGAIGILEGKVHEDGSVKNRHTFTCVSDHEAVHNDATPGVMSPQRIKIADFLHHTGKIRLVESYYVHRLVSEQ